MNLANCQVAHVCALLRRNVVGFKIARLSLNNDPLLFTFLKNNANAEKDLATLHDDLMGSTVVSSGRHGKYFWLRLALAEKKTTGVLLMHFGMTGMIKIRNVHSHLIFMENGGDKAVLEKLSSKQETVSATKSKFFKKVVKDEQNVEILVEETSSTEVKGEPPEELLEGSGESIKLENVLDGAEIVEDWPPKFTKFEMLLEKDEKKFDLVFTDPRRLGRVRFLTGDEVQTDEGLLNVKPLSELGPDYSKPLVTPKEKDFVFGDPDPDHHGRPILDLQSFNKLVLTKKKPIKSLLLEQQFFAGVGNWVADEVIHQSRLHPNEVLSHKLSFDQDEISPVVQRLYESLIYVCSKSVQVEGDVTQFPLDWLMLHRWGKRRKNDPRPLVGGHPVDYMTIGGRTSCFVPKLQKLLTKSTAEGEGKSKRVKVLKT